MTDILDKRTIHRIPVEEVKKILIEHLQMNGEIVPDGKSFMWFPKDDYNSPMRHDEKGNLIVDEKFVTIGVDEKFTVLFVRTFILK